RVSSLVLASLVAMAVDAVLSLAAGWVAKAGARVLECGMQAWTSSAFVASPRVVGLGRKIYTNGIDVLSVYSDQLVFGLPQKSGNLDIYHARLMDIETRLQRSPAVLVYFDSVEALYPYPSIAELREAIPLRMIDLERDGAVYL